MKNHQIILAFMLILSSCHPDCTGSNTCIGPPDGTFQEEKINVAFFGSLAREVGGSLQAIAELDSINVHIESGNIWVKDFYYWTTLENTPTRLEIYFENQTKEVSQADFEFINSESFTNGGFLLTVVQRGEDFFLQVHMADQDLIDGVCNDTINC